MDVRTDEIAEQIYRVSVFVPDAAGGAGFTFNHFLIVGEVPSRVMLELGDAISSISRVPCQAARSID